MSHMIGVPRLPEPTKVWSLAWMQDFIRVLTTWMMHVVTETSEEKASILFPVVTVDTALGDAYRNVRTDGDLTITLPDPATVRGVEFLVKNVGVGTVNVDTVAGDIEALSPPYVMTTQYEAVCFKSDGTDYWIV